MTLFRNSEIPAIRQNLLGLIYLMPQPLNLRDKKILGLIYLLPQAGIKEKQGSGSLIPAFIRVLGANPCLPQ